jgi:rRNA processing protein Krr1/Pno1
MSTVSDEVTQSGSIDPTANEVLPAVTRSTTTATTNIATDAVAVVATTERVHSSTTSQEATAAKQLKSSDDSDNTGDKEETAGASSSGRSSATDDENLVRTDNTLKDTSDPTTNSIAAGESSNKDIEVSTINTSTVVDTSGTPEPVVLTVATAPANENPSSVIEVSGVNPAIATAPTHTSVDVPVDPRFAAASATTTTTTTAPALVHTGVAVTTAASTNVVAAVGDPRMAATAATIPVVPTMATTTTGGGLDPHVAATLSNPEQLVEEVGTVSALYVGRVIGKGGEMIRDLQARSGCRIDVDQNVPIGQPRVITYRGTRETVDFAKHLVQMLSTDGVHENDLPLGNASQEFVIIPAQSVGKVIGRGGEMIRELQSRSQAKIQIDHTGQSGIPADQKQVTITGTHEAVMKGKEMVLLLVANPLMDAQQSLNMLMDDKIRGGSNWGSGPPYLNLPNHGINMQPHMVAPSFQGGAQGYGMYGQPSMGAVPQPMQSGMMAGGYPPQQTSNMYATGTMGYPTQHLQQQQQQPQQTYLGDGRETELLFVSKQFMGRIIGSKGVTINDLQRRSACDIQINQDVPPGKDCEVTIKGSRMGIDSAKAMIQEIIEVGPQHPYAGGMENYTGGGGVKNMGMGGTGGYHGAYVQQPQQQQQQQQYNPYQQQPVYDQAAYGQVAYTPQMSTAGYGSQGMGSAGYGQPMAQQQPASYTQVYGGGGYAAAPQIAAMPRQGPPPVSPWKAATSPDGQVYYYNELTGETQWEKPPGMP